MNIPLCAHSSRRPALSREAISGTAGSLLVAFHVFYSALERTERSRRHRRRRGRVDWGKAAGIGGVGDFSGPIVGFAKRLDLGRAAKSPDAPEVEIACGEEMGELEVLEEGDPV